MQKKRILLFTIAFFFVLFIYILRLSQLQLFDSTHFSKYNVNLLKNSVEQRGQSIVLDEGRGHFLFSDGSAMDYEEKEVIVIFPFVKTKIINWTEIAQILGIEEDVVTQQLYEAEKPFILKKNNESLHLTVEQVNKINKLQIEGIFAVSNHERLEKRVADHLIGITGENNHLLKSRYNTRQYTPNTLIGLSGLERSFDYFLIGSEKTKLVYYTDKLMHPLFGENVKYLKDANPFFPLKVKTTINKNFQLEMEQQINNSFIKKGGALLLDIETNDLLAIVSLPAINQKNPYDAINGNIKNEMFSEQIIGSVFKTVVAAAAIENVDTNRLFDCDKNIFGKNDSLYHYGMLDFETSFAKSCNNTFGTLSKDLSVVDEKILEVYAERIGLIGQQSWRGKILQYNDFYQILEEQKGRVFLETSLLKDNNYIAQTGIGQQEVRATPLGVANMMATIARSGEKKSVRVVSEIQYKNGSTIVEFPIQEIEGAHISPITAMKLQTLLKKVIINGTAKELKNLSFSIAGKTGTAETGKWSVTNEPLYNKWMAGYFPYEKPKYALVVVSLDTTNSNEKIVNLFGQLAQKIMDY